MSSVELYVPLALVLITAIALHEFGHAWVAYKLGDDTPLREGRVTLNPISHLDLWGSICFIVTQGFGWGKPVNVNPTNFSQPRRDDILVTAAGPFANLVLGVASGLIYFGLAKHGYFNAVALGTAPPLLKLAATFLDLMIRVNFFLMFFNLIPIYPLDGSHIVQNLLPLNQAYEFKRFNEQYGPWLLLGLIIFGMNSQYGIISMLINPPTQFLIKSLQSLAFAIF